MATFSVSLSALLWGKIMLVWTLLSFPSLLPFGGVEETRWVLAEVADPRPLQFLGEAPKPPPRPEVQRGCQTPPFLGFATSEECQRAMGITPSPTPSWVPSFSPSPSETPQGYWPNDRLASTAWEKQALDAERLCLDTQGTQAYGLGVTEQGTPLAYWQAATFSSPAECVANRGIPPGSSAPLYFADSFSRPSSSSTGGWAALLLAAAVLAFLR